MGDSGGTLWSMRTKARQPWWSYLADDELLQMRLKDLNVSIEGTWLQGSMKELNSELKRRGLVLSHGWRNYYAQHPDELSLVHLRNPADLDKLVAEYSARAPAASG